MEESESSIFWTTGPSFPVPELKRMHLLVTSSTCNRMDNDTEIEQIFEPSIYQDTPLCFYMKRKLFKFKKFQPVKFLNKLNKTKKKKKDPPNYKLT